MQESRSRIDPTSQGSAPLAADPSNSAILASSPPTSDMIASGESDSRNGGQRREINLGSLISVRQTSQDKVLGAASVKISEGDSDPTISWGIGVRDEETSIEINSEPPSSPWLEVEGARQELDIQSVDSKVIPCPLDVVILEELEEGNRLRGMLADQMEGTDAHKMFVKMPTRTSFRADALGLNFSTFKPRIDDGFGIEQGPMANSWPYDRGKGVLIVNTSSLLDCGMEGIGFELLRSYHKCCHKCNWDVIWAAREGISCCHIWYSFSICITGNGGVIACLVEVTVDYRPELSNAIVVVGKLFQIVNSGCWCGAERMGLYWLSECILIFDPGGDGSTFRKMRQQIQVAVSIVMRNGLVSSKWQYCRGSLRKLLRMGAIGGQGEMLNNYLSIIHQLV